MKLEREARMTIQCLAERGQSRRRIAGMLGVSEGTVRYHLRRAAEAAVDGRSLQAFVAEKYAGAITAYLESVDEGPVNLAALFDWLKSEHEYTGSLRSLQRYFRRRYPKPAKRARRRVETPPGAQAQLDWADWPRVRIAGREVYAYEFHMKLSFSRFGARVWAPRKDQLSWKSVHNDAFRRIGGVPAVARMDNEKTVMSRGAGPWGEINRSYRQYARAVRFHIDACLPRSPWTKGKVERGIGSGRGDAEIRRRDWSSWQELQDWSDERSLLEAHRRICPATGSSVYEAWEMEKPFLAAVPHLPEPFDVAVTRRVDEDCTVAFEGRRYSVPFVWLDRRVEVRGCNRVVQIWAEGHILAEHERGTRERIVIDPRHYEGPASTTALPPLPLGRMGRELLAIAKLAPQKRPLDLYAALAEVAR